MAFGHAGPSGHAAARWVAPPPSPPAPPLRSRRRLQPGRGSAMRCWTRPCRRPAASSRHHATATSQFRRPLRSFADWRSRRQGLGDWVLDDPCRRPAASSRHHGAPLRSTTSQPWPSARNVRGGPMNRRTLDLIPVAGRCRTRLAGALPGAQAKPLMGGAWGGGHPRSCARTPRGGGGRSCQS